jgi:hypothetical protein
MWRFCASLPLCPSLCALGLRVNDPCLPASKGHGPMACVVQPPFRALLHGYLLNTYDSVFAFLSVCYNVHSQEAISVSANQNSSIFFFLFERTTPCLPAALNESYIVLTVMHCAC